MFIYFIYLKGRKRDKDTAPYPQWSIYWFTSQMSATTSTGQAQNQESGTPSGSCMWVARVSAPESLFVAFQSPVVGCWIWTRGARTLIGPLRQEAATLSGVWTHCTKMLSQRVMSFKQPYSISHKLNHNGHGQSYITLKSPDRMLRFIGVLLSVYFLHLVTLSTVHCLYVTLKTEL